MTEKEYEVIEQFLHDFGGDASFVDRLQGIPDFVELLSSYAKKVENKLIPNDAQSFEVFAIKDCEDSPTGKQAFIGFKNSNNDFHFVGVPFTEPKVTTNTAHHAQIELEVLSKSNTNPDNRPIIEPFIPEILELCEKFGNSGQSGGSAPYTARAITQTLEKLLLQEPICPITGVDEEWNDITEMNGGETLYQNNRCSGIFKEGKDGDAYYIDAIVKETQTGSRWSGPFWLSKEDYLSGDKSRMMSCRQYIKSFPFTPKTFYINVIEEEVAEDDWEMWVEDQSQLDEVFKYYR